MINRHEVRADAAESLAIQALSFLADDEKRLERFVEETGMTPDALRARGADAEMLGSILDYVIAFDDRLLNFAEFAQVKPASVVTMRRALPGAPPEW
jgi:hypothetical protein